MATTPNMSLDKPVVSGTDGPLWATMLNAISDVIDEHDHSLGKGARVTPAGLNISSALTFAGNDATSLRSTRFTSQASVFALAADVNAAYVVNNELYFRDGNGNNVKITNGGVINAAALNANTFPQQDVSSDMSITAGNANTHFAVDASAGNRELTLPFAAAVAAGRYYLFSDSTGSCSASRIISVIADGDDLFEGASTSVVIDVAYAWVLVVRTSDMTWRVFRSTQRATSTAYGSILLTGDLSGTAASPTVVKANGADIPAAGSLTTGHYLRVSGASALEYGALPEADTVTEGILRLAQDLGGSSTAPTVTAITGTAGVGLLRMQDLRWPDSVSNPSFGHLARSTAGGGTDLMIYAQDAHTNGNGGGIVLVAGAGAGTGTIGRIELGVGGIVAKTTMVEVATPVLNQAVVALCGNSPITSAQMPVNSGDGVVWLGNAFTAPTAEPGTGCIVYSSGDVFSLWPADSSVGYGFGAFLNAAVSGSQTKKIKVVSGGSIYYIPLYTA